LELSLPLGLFFAMKSTRRQNPQGAVAASQIHWREGRHLSEAAIGIGREDAGPARAFGGNFMRLPGAIRA
jgi:hypothetical protein